jgi:hypothetical protein
LLARRAAEQGESRDAGGQGGRQGERFHEIKDSCNVAVAAIVSATVQFFSHLREHIKEN